MEERLGGTSPSILKLYLNDDAGKGLREVGEALALGAKFKGARHQDKHDFNAALEKSKCKK